MNTLTRLEMSLAEFLDAYPSVREDFGWLLNSLGCVALEMECDQYEMT